MQVCLSDHAIKRIRERVKGKSVDRVREILSNDSYVLVHKEPVMNTRYCLFYMPETGKYYVAVLGDNCSVKSVIFVSYFNHRHRHSGSSEKLMDGEYGRKKLKDIAFEQARKVALPANIINSATMQLPESKPKPYIFGIRYLNKDGQIKYSDLFVLEYEDLPVKQNFHTSREFVGMVHEAIKEAKLPATEFVDVSCKRDSRFLEVSDWEEYDVV